MDKIQVQSPTTKGGAKLLLYSLLCLLLLVCFSVILAEPQHTIALSILIMLSLLGMIVGWSKLREPVYFLECDDQGVHYHHINGSWLLPWTGFLYCTVPQLENNNIAFIGFKVTDYDTFLNNLSLRLAVKIMHEQRALFMEALKLSCRSGQCLSELMTDIDKFKTKEQRYDGVKAVFANRMTRLAAVTGYDIFVPVNFPEPVRQQLCQRINRTRLQLIQNTVT